RGNALGVLVIGILGFLYLGAQLVCDLLLHAIGHAQAALTGLLRLLQHGVVIDTQHVGAQLRHALLLLLYGQAEHPGVGVVAADKRRGIVLDALSAGRTGQFGLVCVIDRAALWLQDRVARLERVGLGIIIVILTDLHP